MSYESKKEIQEVIEETLKERDCPECHCRVSMVEVQQVEKRGTDDEDWVSRYRCLGCLKLYKKTMVEV